MKTPDYLQSAAEIYQKATGRSVSVAPSLTEASVLIGRPDELTYTGKVSFELLKRVFSGGPTAIVTLLDNPTFKLCACSECGATKWVHS